MFDLDNTSGYSQTELDLFNCVLDQLRVQAFGSYVLGDSPETDELIAQLEKHWSERIQNEFDSGATTYTSLLRACTSAEPDEQFSDDDNDDDNVEYTVEVVQMSHYCAASWEANRIAKWDAKVCIYENGYMDEVTTCPACGSTVSLAIDKD
jgi:hypothetical protein